MYAKHMGHVDRVDKNVSLSRLRLKRCIKRYHRALFIWYMAIVLNNILVLFGLFFCDVDELMKNKARIGYKHWFQNQLGNTLIVEGIRICVEALKVSHSNSLSFFIHHHTHTHSGTACSLNTYFTRYRYYYTTS